jgi:FkbM family methyltransferase
MGIQVIANSDPPEIENRLWQGWQGDKSSIAFYVGANAGQHFAKLTEHFARVFAFEPNPDSVEVARHIAQAVKSHQIDVLQMAVSDHDGRVELANLLGTRQERTGQYVTPGVSGMEWDPGITEWNNPARVQRVEVPCATLDSLSLSLGPPDFVVVDTEGHELKVVEGAKDRVLTDVRPGFLIEFHTPENHDTLVKVFNRYGYWAETVRHPHYPPQTLMWYQHGWIKARPYSQITIEDEDDDDADE